jgi:hypothetical protein
VVRFLVPGAAGLALRNRRGVYPTLVLSVTYSTGPTHYEVLYTSYILSSTVWAVQRCS